MSAKSNSSVDTLTVGTQYGLSGNFYTTGSGSFSVSPPSTSDPDETTWNTAPEAPEEVVSPDVQFDPYSVTFEQSGTSLQEELSKEFESAVNDASAELESVQQSYDDENVSEPTGSEQLEPVAKSAGNPSQAPEEAAVEEHAPPPGQAIKSFREQGYDVKGLGRGRLQLTRDLTTHSGQSKIVHVYDVRDRQIVRTRQYRNGQVVAEHRFETQNGQRQMVTTHFDENGNPSERSAMSPGN
jgi:hypothetical protein